MSILIAIFTFLIISLSIYNLYDVAKSLTKQEVLLIIKKATPLFISAIVALLIVIVFINLF